MRWWLAWIWLGSSVAGAVPLRVSVDRPCQFEWRDSVHDWQAVTNAVWSGSTRADLDLPEGASELRASSSSLGGLVRWSGKERFSGKYVELHLLPSPDWPAVGFLGSVSLVAGVFVARWRQSAQKKQLEEALEPMIKSDGSIPLRSIGGYRCTELLGSGAMGVVYKAQAADGFPCAIKVPNPQLVQGEDFKARFAREVELGLQLRHPYIVRVLELPTGSEPYIVLEFVQGTPLDAVPCLGWPKEWRRTRRWMEQILDALVYMHGRGVIHRDLKPSNLMVEGSGNIKLMDFGIAHKLHGTKLTGTDEILGTAPYMAPEQLSGREVTPSIDLYAAGVIFYERLAGFHPFPGELGQIFHAKMNGELTPLHEVDYQIGLQLSSFVARLTANDPAERFGTAQEALLALRRLRD